MYSCVQNESVASQMYPGMEDFKWRRESVLLLISLYRAKRSEFVSGFVKKRDLWSQVASEMSSQGFMVNLIACEKKWHNLSATYRRLKECSLKKRSSWPYFQQLQELLEDNFINSDLNKDCTLGNQANCNVKLESPPPCETHNCSMNPWLPAFPQQMRSPPAGGESGSGDHDISNMLSVNIEENLDQSHAAKDQIHMQSSYLSRNSDDFKWTHDSVMLLCSLYLLRKEQFLSGAVKKRDLWSDIALEMTKEGFNVTCIACEKKWHNLIATYKKVSMYSRKKTWPYLRIFQKIIEEQAMHSASCGLTELSHYPNSYTKNSDNSLNQKQFSKEGEFGTSDPIMFTEQKATDEFKWTHASVISLCNLYKEKRHDFFSNAVRKRDLWLDISQEMNSQGHNVTWLHCEKKWYNLYATYKKVTDQNRKKTRIWSTWPYLKFFQEIFAVDSNEYEQKVDVSYHQTRAEDCNNAYLGCAPPSPMSEKSCEVLSLPTEFPEQTTKKQCISNAPEWFLDYCRQQRELEDRRQEENERHHQELLKAISIGNSALIELNCNLKIFLSKTTV